jgi:hypothetical protein
LFVQRSNVVLTHTREQQNWKLQLLGNLHKQIQTHIHKTKLEVIWKFKKLAREQQKQKITWKFVHIWKFTKLAKEQKTLPNPHSIMLSSLFNVVHCGVDVGWVDGYSFALGCLATTIIVVDYSWCFGQLLHLLLVYKKINRNT